MTLQHLNSKNSVVIQKNPTFFVMGAPPIRLPNTLPIELRHDFWRNDIEENRERGDCSVIELPIKVICLSTVL